VTERLPLIIYFALLFLFWLFSSSPPSPTRPTLITGKSFFTFHQVRADPDLSVWPYIVNHDPWRHGTFRPLLYTILYLEHRVFREQLCLDHISNFLCYCIFLILLYILGKRLGARSLELAGFLAVFAVLYSHCDVLSLTFHISLLLGLCALMIGFILYLGYLDRRNGYILFAAGFFFLLGMLCYEIFILWPLGLIILVSIRAFTFGDRSRSRILRRVTILAVAILYLAYGGVIVFSVPIVKLKGLNPY